MNKVNSQQLLGISVGKNSFFFKKMLPSFLKEILLAYQRSNIVYKYLRHCDSAYQDRTSQRLAE